MAGRNIDLSGTFQASESSRGVNNKETGGNTKDYISGDSTPSSSGHQFPWIATDPKNQSKKSAKKENS